MTQYFNKKNSVIAIIIIFILILSFEYYYSDKFYPHIFINNIEIGGMTLSQAREKIIIPIENIKTNGFNLEFIRGNNIKKVNIPLALTGFTSDTVVEYFSIENTEETIRKAYEWGREPSLISRWFKKIFYSLSEKRFVVPHSVKKEAVFSLLKRELNGFLNGPQNARFIESGGEIAITEGKFGADVDYEKIVNSIENALFDINTEDLKFEVKLIAPPITAEDLKLKLNFVNKLSRSINLEFWNGPYWWRARGPILATWLTLNNEDKGIIKIADDKLKNFVRINVDLPIKENMTNSRFEMKNNELVETIPGQAGLEIDFNRLKGDIEKEIQRIFQEYNENKIKPETIKIQFTIEKVPPKITKETIAEYKITDLIGKAQTSFSGSSAARITNIKIGTSKLNGILIAPGEEFSAVKTIGEVTEEEGYKKEFVIKMDKSVEEFGGGLCQIATTLFRLALNTGLSITERQNHSYVVGYYGPGLDATIYGPHPDLRFINNTENYILLQGIVEKNTLTFEFYGRKDGRKISISEPRVRDKISPPDTKFVLTADLPLAQKKCTERRREGLTTETDYRVEYADSSIHEETFISEYKPWQEVCLLGTRFP
ncbi:MAG: VanW family protein [Minisyncoccota bacterium]